MTLSNVPQDGFWQAFDSARLISPDYLNNHYLSSSILFVSSLSQLINGFAGFNPQQLGINFDFSFLNVGSDISSLIQTVNSSSTITQVLNLTGYTNDFQELASINYQGILNGIIDGVTNVVLPLLNMKGTRMELLNNHQMSTILIYLML